MATTTPVHEPVTLPRRDSDAAAIRGAAVAAVGVSVPARSVRNSEIEPRLGVADGWIERRTGIRSRRIAGPDESLAACAAHAALHALARAGVDGSDVDLVLVATTTADDVLPNAAPLVAAAIGASRAGAFDIGAACTGFLSALAIGCGQIECRRARTAVIVGVDFMSRITDPLDRGTAAVFADGAGAAVLVASDDGRIGPVVLGSDAAGADHIHVRRSHPVIFMQGHETFREAVARLSESTVEACAAAGVGLSEIDKFVYHQANGRILAAVGERLGLDPRRVIDCISEYGNTSAATLPLALDAADLAPGDLVLLGAFGAGFTWGATVVRWGAHS
ncbi:MAG TPA: beta-ketoacyl-ACP synthase 3 [Solirubrobacteraceae bacterium]|nr:beta-ketoacyl-ACP synthase 3 [Solirubrobacteraceae bacterium]